MKQLLIYTVAGIISFSPVLQAAGSETLSASSATGIHKKLSKQISHLQQEANRLEAELRQRPMAMPVGSEKAGLGTNWFPIDFGVPGRSFVSTGPYIGVPVEYTGGHLIINSPTVNQDYALLKLRYNIHSHLRQAGFTEPPGSAHLLLSGIVEGSAVYQMSGGQSNASTFDLSAANFDMYLLGPGDWLSALMGFSYDSASGATTGSRASNSAVQNSRIYLKQGFLTIGRLSQTPWYGTLGQLYVPFGTYSSNMTSAPLTRGIGGTLARAVVVGWQPVKPDTFYGAGYFFRGDSHAGSSTRLNNAGLNAGYRFVQGPASADFGAGIIANIADAARMQTTGNSAGVFNGFGGTSGTGNEAIAHRVPALNIHGLVNVGPQLTLLGEYVTATTHFSPSDLTMNGRGAKPQALNAEAAWTFEAFSHPASIAAGYGMTKEVAALGLPAQRYALVFNTSVWRDTLQSLEFTHEKSYAASTAASGSGIAATPQDGRANNTITAQFDLFF